MTNACPMNEAYWRKEMKMLTVRCIRHPKYNGKNPPDLRCQTCCSLYLSAVKAADQEEFKANPVGPSLSPELAGAKKAPAFKRDFFIEL